MLNVEEVQAILDAFAKSKKKVEPAKGKKGVVDNSVELETKRSSLEVKPPGSKFYFENIECDKSNYLNNSNKPYYCCEMLKLEKDEAIVSLTEKEAKEPHGLPAIYKKPKFNVSILKLLEHSMIAEEGTDDMVDIDELNPATLLYNLAGRYKADEVYTYVGPILLALNPFKKIDRLYGDEFNDQFLRIAKDPSPLSVKRELPPHQNAISGVAYANLKNERRRQAIVISGESGSGKTESAKLAMNYLTILGRQGGGEGGGNADIGERILACNPILEGFGNSKTQRNDNSSRFGKYTKMYFGLYEDAVYGAMIKNYLLEKSRVISVSQNERGYHVFYFMLKAMPADLLKKYNLLDAKTGKGFDPLYFKYLAGGGPNGTLPDKHDVEGYIEIADTFKQLQFTDEEMDAVWRCNSVVLHLGNIELDPKLFDDASAPTKPGGFTKKGQEELDIVSKMLGVESAILAKAIVQKVTKIRGEEMWANLGVQKATDNKNALAKQLFNNMFNWLVKKMNTTIQPPEIADASFHEKAKTVGLLDIFGFENFVDLKPGVQANNNFEQLCINYVNEKLHKLYISAIFEAEKSDLRAEGLGARADEIEFVTNVDDIIMLIDYTQNGSRYRGKKITPPPPPGLFPFIDDFVNSGRYPEPKKLEEDLKKSYGKVKDVNGKSIFVTSMKRKCQFQITHSAESVWYDAQEFVERDVDFIPEALEQVMTIHADQLVRFIYRNCIDTNEEEEQNEALKNPKKGGKAKTIWNSFSAQMEDLMYEMAEMLIKSGNDPIPTNIPDGVEPTDLHFIRCIKPRPKPMGKEDQPGLFVYTMTLQQITYMGVLESVELKQKNFPFRKKFEEFYAEFELLAPRFATVRYNQMDKNSEDFEGMAKNIVSQSMKGLGEEFYALGNTKILMMPETKEILMQCKAKASQSRNIQADVLKKAFPTRDGALFANRKREAMRAAQVRYKLKYNKKQRAYAQQFKSKFDQAITAFKADKRKLFEMKAVIVFKDVVQKNIFRNQLNEAMRARSIVAKSAYNSVYIQRLTKYLIANTLATRVAHQAFTRARERINGHAVWHVQRAFRGYMCRSQGDRMDWVKEAISSKENLRLEVSAKKVQKKIKGIIVRRRIAVLSKTAATIQSHFRMHWFRQVYQMILRNTKILQRGMRKYMARRDMIKERMKIYLTQEFTVMNNVREMEQFQLFGNDADPDLLKQHSPYGIKKIFLFNRLADMHVLTDLSAQYPTPWAAQWMKIYRDGILADKPVMQLEIGATHSIASTGRGIIYSWGWNDNGQCAKDPEEVDEIVVRDSTRQAIVNLDSSQPSQYQFAQKSSTVRKARQILAVEDRSFVLVKDTNELIAWGGNEKGQLGLGHYQNVETPTKMEFFSKIGQTVNSISGGGDLTLASTDTGDSYAWPFVKSGQKYSIPVRMPFSDKIKVTRVSCGHNFGFFISSQGLVYAVGRDNQDGQLGLGHVYPNDIPELVSCFKEAGERIDSIECGFRHAIARSTLGKVYTWGWNMHGQLGHGHYDSELSPRQLQLERGRLNKDKAIQIAAGYSHTIIMTDNKRELIWFGSSGQLHKQASPEQLVLSETLPSLFPDNQSSMYAPGQAAEFAVVKVSCSWSKSLSLTNFMIADLRSVNKETSHTKLQNAIKILSQQWDQREVMPPYINVISGLFNATVMRKKDESGTTKTSDANMSTPKKTANPRATQQRTAPGQPRPGVYNTGQSTQKPMNQGYMSARPGSAQAEEANNYQAQRRQQRAFKR